MWNPIFLQIGDHLLRIFESRGRELIIASPVGLEPARIEMDHVAGNPVLPELGRDLSGLILGKVRDAAHPQAERPQRRHGCLAGQA